MMSRCHPIPATTAQSVFEGPTFCNKRDGVRRSTVAPIFTRRNLWLPSLHSRVEAERSRLVVDMRLIHVCNEAVSKYDGGMLPSSLGDVPRGFSLTYGSKNGYRIRNWLSLCNDVSTQFRVRLSRRSQARRWKVCSAAASSGDGLRGLFKGQGGAAHHSQDVGAEKKEVPKELLAQARKRREFERLQREREAEFNPPEANAMYPFWRKNRDRSEMEAKKLTRRIVELGRRKQLDQVFETLRTARQSRITLNIITVNAALAACVNCGDIDRALELYRMMVHPGGVGADNITYGTLLKGLGQAKRLDDAFELLEKMEAGTAPGKPNLTDVHLNTLVNACAEAGEALRAKGLLSRFKSFGQGLGPSAFTYNLLIKGYARSDNPLEAITVMHEMQLQGMPLQRLAYNSLLLACVRGKDLESALDILEDMKAEARRLNTSRLLPDVVTYTTLLKGFAEEGDLQGVLALMKEMKSSPVCAVDRVAYAAMVDACIQAGSAEDGLRVMAEMEERARQEPQFRPRPHVFLALMRAFAEQGKLPRTRELAHRMVPALGWHVWPEDRAEAEELVMEAAVNAGELKEARQVLSQIVKSQGEKLHFTPRGDQALVRLLARANYSHPKFQPVLFKPEISPRSKVTSVMLRMDALHPISANQRVAEVAIRFLRHEVLPVCDKDSRCIGLLFPRDCSQLNVQVRDVMHPPPPRIGHNAPISQAAELMFSEKSMILTVVKAYSINTKYGIIRDTYSEDLGNVALGFITTSRVFDVQGQRPGSVLFGNEAKEGKE